MRNDGSLLPFDLDYHDDAPTLDIDAIVRRGHSRLRRRRLAAGGAALTAVLAVAAVTAVAHAREPTGTSTVPLAGRGLLAQHPAAGRIDVLKTKRGWHPVVYRESTGGLCEGWINPASKAVTGACVEPATDRSGQPIAVTPPVLVEPQAGVSGGTIEAFGLTGPLTRSVELTGTGIHTAVQLSFVRSAGGDRAWLASFPVSPHRRHGHVRLVAHGRHGAVIDSVSFEAPVASSGQDNPVPASSASVAPTPSDTPGTAEPTPSDTPGTAEPTPSQPADSSEPTPGDSPDSTGAPPSPVASASD